MRVRITPDLVVTVPKRYAAAVALHCAEHNENPAHFVTDAIALHLDALAGMAPEIPVQAGIGDEAAPSDRLRVKATSEPARPAPGFGQAQAANAEEWS